jgi:hypothetical protein
VNIDTLEAIAVAVAAHEYNTGYIKQAMFTELNDVEKWPNKDIMYCYFQIDYYSVQDPLKRPPFMKITDTHRAQANDIRAYTKKNLFKALSYNPQEGNFPPYDVSMFQKLNQETITYKDFGFIASAPFYYENNKNRDLIKDTVENSQSQHIGTIGSKVVIDEFKVLRSNSSKSFPGYIVQGIADGNLFLFFSSYDLKDIKPFDIISISGRVRDHILEKDKYPMTKLNHVNVKKGDQTYEKRVDVRTDDFSSVFG